jgi:hypothetical protein
VSGCTSANRRGDETRRDVREESVARREGARRDGGTRHSCGLLLFSLCWAVLDVVYANKIQVLCPLIAFERDPGTRLALWKLVGALIDKVPRGAAQIDIFQDVSVYSLGRTASGGRRDLGASPPACPRREVASRADIDESDVAARSVEPFRANPGRNPLSGPRAAAQVCAERKRRESSCPRQGILCTCIAF